MKREKGITLVALVVTIIVLIILVGVSINLVLENNGIITIAKKAKQNTELAKIEENAILGDYNNEIGKYANGIREPINQTLISNNMIEKIQLETLKYTFSAGTYTVYTQTKNIDLASIYPDEYEKFNENNFSYEISELGNGYIKGDLYVGSYLRKPNISYDNVTGTLSLSLSVLNGQSDYIKSINVNVYLFKIKST